MIEFSLWTSPTIYILIGLHYALKTKEDLDKPENASKLVEIYQNYLDNSGDRQIASQVIPFKYFATVAILFTCLCWPYLMIASLVEKK